MERKLILVTNDDGITAPGIRNLIAVARELGEVVVVAPDAPQSAKGHAVTLSSPLRIRKVDIFEGIEAYECSGTPVDCVKLGIDVPLRGRTPDLCVSGINHGSNASINILYSGTVSAAMEAAVEGITAIGFSLLDFSVDADFEPGKLYIKQLIQEALAGKFPKGTLLNVNIPKGTATELKGIKYCRQAEGKWEEEFAEATDPRGEKYYWLKGKFVNYDKGENSDLAALKEGYISVVPCMHDLTDHDLLKILNK